MSLIRLPQQFLAQPQYPVPIDYQGLGKGIKLLFNPAVGPVDLATGNVWMPNGSASNQVTTKGKVLDVPAASSFYSYTGYPEISGSVGTFFMWFPRVGGASSFGHIYFIESSAAAYHQITNGGNVLFGGATGGGSIPSWFNTTDRSLILSSDGTAAGTKCFVDGKDSGITWGGSGAGSWPTGNKALRLGNYAGGSGWDTNASFLSFGYTSAVWSETEALAFHQNPWVVFKASSKYVFIPAAGGSPNTYTISPSGSIDISGTSGILKTKVFLPSGKVSFNGSSLLTKTKLFAPSGEVSLYGAANIMKGRVLSPSGGLSFSGSTLPTKSKIIAPSGSVAFSGTASLSGAISFQINPSGSVYLLGSAKMIKTKILNPTGRVSFGGSAPMTSNTVTQVVSSRLPMTGAGQ